MSELSEYYYSIVDALEKAVEKKDSDEFTLRLLLAYVELDEARTADIPELELSELQALDVLMAYALIGNQGELYSLSPELWMFRNRLENEIALREKPIDGYVYLLKSDSGYWKIGRSKNPASRIKTFGVKMPFRIEYKMVIPSKNHKDLEEHLHEIFSDKRIEGEWFDLNEEDLMILRSRFPNKVNEFNGGHDA